MKISILRHLESSREITKQYFHATNDVGFGVINIPLQFYCQFQVFTQLRNISVHWFSFSQEYTNLQQIL